MTGGSAEGGGGAAAKGFKGEAVEGAKGFEEGVEANGFDDVVVENGFDDVPAGLSPPALPPKINPPRSTATAFGCFSFFSSSNLAFSSGDSFHIRFALNARILPSFFRQLVRGHAKT